MQRVLTRSIWSRRRDTFYCARRSFSSRPFPNQASLLRLATAYLKEQDEERLTERRYMSLGSLSEVATDALAPVSSKFIA